MGKIATEKVHFGKVVQHKDILKCSIGTIGLVFLGRFHVIKENLTMDFTNITYWFNKKILSLSIGQEHGKRAYYITEYCVI